MNRNSALQGMKSPWTARLVFSLLLACSYLWVLRISLPAGINQQFVTVLLPLTSVVIVVGLMFLRGRLQHGDAGRTAINRFPIGDVLLLSLPLAPIAQYLALNQQTLYLLDTVIVLLGSVGLLLLVVLVIPWMLRRWIAYSAAVLLLVALSYTLLNMASMARANHWHQTGAAVPQMLMFIVVLGVCSLLYRLDRRGLYLLSLCFFVGTLGQTLWLGENFERKAGSEFEHQRTERTSRYPWVTEFEEREIRRNPSVFLMTYDSYVENETLLQYGIDNSDQEQYLAAAGFQLYPGVYSVAATSRDTMSRVLGTASALKGVAGFNPVVEVLRRKGYTTFGLFKSDYFFNGVGMGYDENFPPPSRPAFALARSIAEGEFRHDASFVDVSHAEFVHRKRRVLSEPAAAPKFVYTHTGPGHSQNSGACRRNETELFGARLEQANEEMRADLDAIIRSHPDAIIIVNGDHGPYLTKNCTSLAVGDFSIEEVNPLDIQDRFGTFLAIRWPQSHIQSHPETIRILQDLFPMVFSYLFAQPISEEALVKPTIQGNWKDVIGGLSVDSGVIAGGAHDGKRLFTSSSLVQR
ncbi:MAG: hypothetical protein AAGG11_19165 [Pseudomonadota bacterium]